MPDYQKAPTAAEDVVSSVKRVFGMDRKGGKSANQTVTPAKGADNSDKETIDDHVDYFARGLRGILSHSMANNAEEDAQLKATDKPENASSAADAASIGVAQANAAR